MRSTTLWRAVLLAIVTIGLGSQGLAQSPLQTKYEGTITDYVQALNTTWLVSGDWSLELKGQSGTGEFSASLSMFDTANPAAVAHTHHVRLKDAEVVVSDDWSGPGRFTLSGVGLVTGNGGPSFPDSPITVAIIGGNAVTFSNIRLTLGGDAATNHFGTVPLGGVVSATR